MFATQDVLIDGVIAALLAGAACYALPWGRAHLRFAVIGVASFLGFIAWNLVISHAKATGLNVDAPVIALSWQDAGSGVLVFATAGLALGGYERTEPAGKVVGAAGLAGVVAMVFDIFVL